MPSLEEAKAVATAVKEWAELELERVRAEKDALDHILAREDKYDEVQGLIDQAQTAEE